LPSRSSSFSDHLKYGGARSVTKDPGAARSMFENAQKRLQFVSSLTIDDDNAPFIFEIIYEVIRECSQSLMMADGYKPENHEVAVAFVSDFHKGIFGESLINEFDRYRKTRHESMYRSGYVSKDMASEALEVAVEYVRITELILNPKLRKN
jgi:hypothetical protein